MLELLEALVAVSSVGTVSGAATRLRLTQSAVTKRIRSLEKTMGYAVLEPDGRRVRLTTRGAALVEQAGPLIAGLRTLGASARDSTPSELTLALSDSIASSWGPEVVRGALDSIPELRLGLHAHRSVLVVESVRLGRYHLGLCAETGGARDLGRDVVVVEPLVLVYGGLKRRSGSGPVITIESGSATWRAVGPLVRRAVPEIAARGFVPVESFAAAFQMVRAGFGDGLVPLGVVLAAGVERGCYRKLAGVSRRISLHSRKTVGGLPVVAKLREALTAGARRWMERGR